MQNDLKLILLDLYSNIELTQRKTFDDLNIFLTQVFSRFHRNNRFSRGDLRFDTLQTRQFSGQSINNKTAYIITNLFMLKQ